MKTKFGIPLLLLAALLTAVDAWANIDKVAAATDATVTLVTKFALAIAAFYLLTQGADKKSAFVPMKQARRAAAYGVGLAIIGATTYGPSTKELVMKFIVVTISFALIGFIGGYIWRKLFPLNTDQLNTPSAPNQPAQPRPVSETGCSESTPEVPTARQNWLFSELVLFWDSFNKIGKFAAVCFFGLIAYAYISDEGKTNTVLPTQSEVKPPISKPTPTTLPVVKNLNMEDQICYVFWDGRKFQIGKTEGENFKRYRRDRYGIDVLEVGIPLAMAETIAPPNKNASKEITKFMDTHWSQIDNLCHF